MTTNLWKFEKSTHLALHSSFHYGFVRDSVSRAQQGHMINVITCYLRFTTSAQIVFLYKCRAWIITGQKETALASVSSVVKLSRVTTVLLDYAVLGVKSRWVVHSMCLYWSKNKCSQTCIKWWSTLTESLWVLFIVPHLYWIVLKVEPLR